MQQMAEAEATTAKVADGGVIVGRLTYRDALTAYKAMLQRSIRRVRALPEQTTILEARLSAKSRLVGTTGRDAKLPHDVLAVSNLRQGEVVFPPRGCPVADERHCDASRQPGQRAGAAPVVRRRG